MKWFKHISDSLDDPFIFDLCQECGPSGYYVFFGVLEIYAREFKVEDGFKLVLSLHYLCTKLVASRKQLIIKALNFCSESGKWDVVFNGKNVEIYIPKFKKYLDEFTLKKLRLGEQKSGACPERVRSVSGVTPKKVRTEVDVEEEVDIKIKTFLSDSVEIRLSNYLFKHVRKNNPQAKEPNIQSWARHIDLMLRVDNRPADDVKKIIEWCQADEFWKANILSTKKLREKYDQLVVKMNGKNGCEQEPRPYAFGMMVHN